MDVIKIFKSKWLRKSARYMRDPAKMKGLVEDAMNLASKQGFEEMMDYLKIVGQYIKAIANGTYKDYSKSKLALAVAALVYLVVPADCVPDFIPLAGYLDDLTVVSFAFKQIRDEIEKYKSATAVSSHEETDDIVFDEAEEIE